MSMRAILITVLLSIAAFAHAWDKSDLDPVRMDIDTATNTGVMLVNWYGKRSMEHYEGRWLDYTIKDTDTGSSVSFEFWVQTWYRVCDPPCQLTMDFVTRNVRHSTE